MRSFDGTIYRLRMIESLRTFNGIVLIRLAKFLPIALGNSFILLCPSKHCFAPSSPCCEGHEFVNRRGSLAPAAAQFAPRHEKAPVSRKRLKQRLISIPRFEIKLVLARHKLAQYVGLRINYYGME